MANISWNFYRSRRKISAHSLIQSGRVADYPTYVAYCNEVRVTPAPESEFASEFGPLLEKPTVIQDVTQSLIVESPASLDPAPELQATVWLAGVDEGSERPTSSPPPRVKKKKAKGADTEGNT